MQSEAGGGNMRPLIVKCQCGPQGFFLASTLVALGAFKASCEVLHIFKQIWCHGERSCWKRRYKIRDYGKIKKWTEGVKA